VDRQVSVTALRCRTSDRTPGGARGAEALEYLHGRFTLALSTDDIQEGVTAFFEKREPVWTGQ